jgi:hypothetical protein
MFGPKRDEVHYSPNISRVIKSRRKEWSVFISMGGEVNTGFWWGNLREKDHLEDPGINERIISRWIFSMLDMGWHGSD